LATIPDEHPSGSSSSETINNSQTEPVLPLEDPDLVGVAAATAARERRIYMTKCLAEQESLRQESNSWDFITIQMTDWEERGRTWNGFKKNAHGKKLLGSKFFRKFLP
jgi:hypothetical protein